MPVAVVRALPVLTVLDRAVTTGVLGRGGRGGWKGKAGDGVDDRFAARGQNDGKEEGRDGGGTLLDLGPNGPTYAQPLCSLGSLFVYPMSKAQFSKHVFLLFLEFLFVVSWGGNSHIEDVLKTLTASVRYPSVPKRSNGSTSAITSMVHIVLYHDNLLSITSFVRPSGPSLTSTTLLIPACKISMSISTTCRKE